MAPPTDPGDPAPGGNSSKSFFDMFPREIRDSIYEHTFDHGMTPHLYHMRFQAPLPHLRLVSRQFKQEYDEQSPTNTSLFVTDQSQPLNFFYSDAIIAGLVLPRLATRCTVVHITQNLQDQAVEEADDMMDQLVYHCDPIHWWQLDQELTLLREVHVKFNFNFVQNLERLFSHCGQAYVCDWFAEHYWPREVYRTSPGRRITTVEFSHLGLASHSVPGQLVLGLPSSESLTQPATLGGFECRDTSEEFEMKFHEDVIEQRSAAEAVFVAAWETKHGCPFGESVRKRYDT
jgi:hypothetical protein